MAEEELFRSLGRARSAIYYQLQVGFPRVEAWCRFLKPARLSDLMEVTTWIGRRTEKSLLFQFEMRREGERELAAEGSYTVVCVNREKFRSMPLPQELLDLLRDYLPPPAPAGRGSVARGHSSAE